MVRRYGWAPRSERLVPATPHGHWRTTTCVAGLRSTGLIAPLVLDGPMDGPAFLAYVERFLAPTLRRGDVVVMDNPGRPQGGGRGGGDQGSRRQRPLPAALLARPEPDRAGVRQAQSPAPRCRGQNQGSALDHHRAAPRPLQPRPVPQLPRQLRIRVHVKQKCSRRW